MKKKTISLLKSASRGKLVGPVEGSVIGNFSFMNLFINSIINQLHYMIEITVWL